MNVHTIESLANRLDLVEKKNRLLKIFVIILFLLISSFFLLGIKFKPPKAVYYSDNFYLLDTYDGTLLGGLGVSGDDYGLSFNGKKGKRIIYLGTMNGYLGEENGNYGLKIYDENSKTRATLLYSDNKISLKIFDEKGNATYSVP